MDRVERASHRYRMSLLVLNIVSGTVLLALLFILLYEVVTLRSLAEDNELSQQILVECTTPGHPCYDRSQLNMQEAVEEIINSIRKDHNIIQRECGK